MGTIITRAQPFSSALTRSDKGRLMLFARTVGKDLTSTERNEAIDWCEVYGANPFTRDIYFFVFDAKDPERRRMVPVLGISMYRKMAARSGDYRPDDRAPRFTYDAELISAANPKGLIDCEVSVYRFSHGSWFPITVRLRWDERAPIKSGEVKWEKTGEVYPKGHAKAGKPKYRKTVDSSAPDILDPDKRNWHTMPETMLAKCCEADAIRRGWPETLSGTYAEGELDAATIDLTASEIIDEAETETKLALAGGKDALTVMWHDGTQLERVPMGQFADKVLAWARHADVTLTEVRIFWNRNLPARIEYKAKHASDYLDLQKQIEALMERKEREDITADGVTP